MKSVNLLAHVWIQTIHTSSDEHLYTVVVSEERGQLATLYFDRHCRLVNTETHGDASLANDAIVHIVLNEAKNLPVIAAQHIVDPVETATGDYGSLIEVIEIEEIQ